eukprot:g32201.t1
MQLFIGNNAKDIPSKPEWTIWECFVKARKQTDLALIRKVEFVLHPTFTPNRVVIEKAPFSIRRRGWGTFQVGVIVTLCDNSTHHFDHQLDFSLPEVGEFHKLPHPQKAPASVPVSDQAKTSHDSKAEEKKGAKGDLAEPSQNSKAQRKKEAKRQTNLPRMTGVPWQTMHGHKGDGLWAAPLLAVACDQEARPGYTSKKATEYLDEPDVLAAKVKVMARLISESPAVVAYTGAGISTSAGISDYATKATNSLAKQSKKRKGSEYEPTFAHHALTTLYKNKMLHHWLQQNHDGLPQKAGFPPEHLNEIHGACRHDPSNPVVPMGGTLRGDLYRWLEEWENKADLTLAIGTSLCGMNADRMVETVSKKALSTRANARGSVIISLQQTQYDEVCSLRIFAKIDDVMELLMKELNLRLPDKLEPYKPNVPVACKAGPDKFIVPYNKKGGKEHGLERTIWDLSTGACVRVTQGPGKGFEGKVMGKDKEGHYEVVLPMQREGHPQHGQGSVRYTLGSWWVQTAVEGKTDRLPIVNI